MYFALVMIALSEPGLTDDPVTLFKENVFVNRKNS